MPVARIITRTPAESEELRRQLTAAGYSVKFTAPDEEFDDADLIVAAANVHVDYALQYAAEVAAEADADVIVAPGAINNAAPAVPAVRNANSADLNAPPAAGVLFGTASALTDEAEEQTQSSSVLARLGRAWQEFRQKRAVSAEEKRLELERRAHERREREQELLQRRAAAEARMVTERERHRPQRMVEEERMRREQEQVRAREMERARAEAEAQRARMAAEAEHARVEQERARREMEQRRALEAETARIAAEAERARIEQERVRVEQDRLLREEHERATREAALTAAAQEAPVPTPAPRVIEPQPTTPYAPVAAGATWAPVPISSRVARPRTPARRTSKREQKLQRAALIASIVTLFAMLALAAVLNVHPSAPMPASVTNNPVQEKSPFGTASIGPSTSIAKPAPAAQPTPQASNRPPEASSRAAMPQNDSTAVPAKPSANKSRHLRRHIDDDVAQDEVVIHHYGAQPQKHPPSTQTRAGVPRYTDQ